MSRQLLLALLVASTCFGQSRPPSVPESQWGNLPAQKIGPDDLLSLFVYASPELTRTVRVGQDGSIRLPMLTSPIPVSGLVPSEVEAAVATALAKEEILVAPVVTVNIAEYNSRPISVSGSVKIPVTFQATGHVTLLDALNRAGGLSEQAATQVLVNRTAEDGTRVTEKISVRQLIEAADPAANLTLNGGEEIRVPESERIFVLGMVRKPGAFVVNDGSVLRLLALAEGLVPFSNKDAYVYRRNSSGVPEEIAIPLRRVLDRKTADVALQPNDILYIPDSRGKRLTAAALEKALMFGTTAGASALMYSAR